MTLRLFIAIELDDAVREALTALQDRLDRQLPPRVVRWTRPESIHLTLKFLGDTPADRVDAVAEAMSRAAAGFEPFPLALAGLGAFPNARRARVIWVGADEPSKALAGLQRAVDLQAGRLGWEREARPFSAHLTFGRVNKGVDRAGYEALSRALEGTRVGRVGELAVSEVVLFQSDLKPGGAVYTALAHAPLARRQP